MTPAEKTANLIINLIEENYENDARFEREMGLAPKTVSNWKRGTSNSFYKMLPELSTALGVTPNYLLGFESRELEHDEVELVSIYRKAAHLTDGERKLLLLAFKNIVNLKLK